MPDTPTISTPPLANPAGAALCRGCSAPLAADQRYCLSCGARVGEPRVAAFELLGAGGAAGPASGAGSPAVGPDSPLRRLDRLGGPMGLAAVVLVALGIGFLLGQGGGGSGAQTIIQRPPVVNVTSAGAAPAGDTSGSAASDSASGAAKDGKGKQDSSADTTGVPKATQDDAGGDLTKLQAQPKEQATEGEPPPPDDKPAGGGSAVETIG